MKKRFRRKITPAYLPTEAQEPDVIWEDGMITIRGEILERLERIADARGMTVPELVNERLHWIMQHPKFEKWLFEVAQYRKGSL